MLQGSDIPWGVMVDTWDLQNSYPTAHLKLSSSPVSSLSNITHGNITISSTII